MLISQEAEQSCREAKGHFVRWSVGLLIIQSSDLALVEEYCRQLESVWVFQPVSSMTS